MTTVNTTSFAKTPQAVDETYSFSEAGLKSNILLLDVMANDLGGNAKTLYSVDDGGSSLTDILSGLVKSDVGSELGGNTFKGGTLKIVDGQVQVDLTAALAGTTFKSLDGIPAGETFVDSFTYAIRLANGTLSWATVTFTITGTNDVPVVTNTVAAATGAVVEAGNADDGTAIVGTAFATGTLTADDVDAGSTQTWSVAGAADATYGTFAVSAATGVWTYTLDNSLSATQALKEGESKPLTYIVRVTDDKGAYANQTVTVTVTGTNDVPVVTNPAASALGKVIEAGHADDGTAAAGQPTATGALSASDVDAGSTQTWSVAGEADATYGTFAVSAATGVWTYTLDNSLSATQALKEGDSKTLSYTVRVTDDKGAYADQTVTVTVTGTNDVPVVTNTVASALGTVIEAGHADDGTAAAGEPTATGTLTASDVDANATKTWSVAGAADATYGTFAVNAATGVWTYTLDNSLSATQEIKEGESKSPSYTVRVTDDKGAYAVQTVTVTVTGTNDVPVVTNTVAAATGAVVEAGHTDDGTATTGTAAATGTLTASDVDANATKTWSVVDAAPDATYGTFAVNAATGVWTYTLDNSLSATQALKEGESKTLSYTARVTDDKGAYAEQAVTVAVTGTNDVPVVSGAVTGTATEDGIVSTLNALANASDVDAGAVLTAVVPAVLPDGVSFNADGQTFTLDPKNAAYQSLAAGATTTVTVNYGVTDGVVSTATPASITWTLTGTNDAPVVSGAVSGTATEDGSVSTLNALANASDVDAGANLAVVNIPALLPAGVSYDTATKSFTLDPASAAYQSLAAGASTTVTFNYGVSDGLQTTPTSASWLVTGVNDAAVFTGAKTGSVTEDGTLAAQGSLIVTDVDAGQSSFIQPTSLNGIYGAFTFSSTSGAWTYALNNTAQNVQALSAGQSVEDRLRVSSADGTTQDIVVQVQGVNEPVNNTVAKGDAIYVSNSTVGVSIPVSALLGNDVAAGGAVFSVGTVADTSSLSNLKYMPGPDGGTVTFDYKNTMAAGSFTYTLTTSSGVSTATVEVKPVDVTNQANLIVLTGDYAASYIDVAKDDDSVTSAIAGAIDTFVGGDGADRLSSGPGSDRLVGGEGNDTLTGGAGSDTFVFNASLSKMGTDSIADFDATNTSAERDFIELSSSVFIGLNAATDPAGTLASVQFASVSSLAAYNQTQAKIVYDQSTGNLYYDADGSAGGVKDATLFATLANKPAGVDASDFKLV